MHGCAVSDVLNSSFQRAFGLDSRLIFNFVSSGDLTVRGLQENLVWLLLSCGSSLHLQFVGLCVPKTVIHSPAIFPSRWPELINTSDADLVIALGVGRVLSLAISPSFASQLCGLSTHVGFLWGR